MATVTMIEDHTSEGTLPLEFVHLPEIHESTVDAARQHSAYVSVHGVNNFGVNRKVNLGNKDNQLGKSRIIRKVEERLGFPPSCTRPRSEQARPMQSDDKFHPACPEPAMTTKLATVEPVFFCITGSPRHPGLRSNEDRDGKPVALRFSEKFASEGSPTGEKV